METKFTVGMKCKTRDGRDARIVATDMQMNGFTILAIISDGSKEYPNSYTPEGGTNKSGYSHPADLILPKRRIKQTWWVNVYEHFISTNRNRTAADEMAAADRLACIPITIECDEGEGL